MLKIVFISGCILLTTISRGQEKDAVELTLDDCIQEALQNNIAIKTAKNNELIARSNQFQSLMNFLPSVTANINYDFFFGTTFDVNAARQVSATTNSSSPNISANWVLFNGLSNLNTRRQRNYEYKSASESVRDVQLTTEANILEFYLNVILGQENIKVAEERVTLLEAQLDREEKRESVGVGNMESVYNFRSQLATERLNLQNLRNDLQRNQLTLFQAMQLELAQINYQVAPIEISEDELLLEADPFDQVLQECLDINPGLNSAKA
ncbi:MAG: TolC family protein, partial [Cyclobacteriaceae bacterium]|nr:TolC family protein [Cyclobacteriaceae bacterium HetDA_MAG_MS6]